MRFEQVQTDSFSEKKILWWGACITCGTNITGIYHIDRHKRLFSMLDKQWKEYDIFSHYIFGGTAALPSLGTLSNESFTATPTSVDERDWVEDGVVRKRSLGRELKIPGQGYYRIVNVRTLRDRVF